VCSSDLIVQGGEIAKRTQQQDHSVTAARETGNDNVRQVKDERRQQEGNPGGSGKKEEKMEESGAQPEAVVMEDYLGRKINITG
jgi:hypothetical protein